MERLWNVGLEEPLRVKGLWDVLQACSKHVSGAMLVLRAIGDVARPSEFRMHPCESSLRENQLHLGKPGFKESCFNRHADRENQV